MDDINRVKPRLRELSKFERLVQRPSGRVAAIQSHDNLLIHELFLIDVAGSPLDALILLVAAGNWMIGANGCSRLTCVKQSHYVQDGSVFGLSEERPPEPAREAQQQNHEPGNFVDGVAPAAKPSRKRGNGDGGNRAAG
jgi:hypothetical protein